MSKPAQVKTYIQTEGGHVPVRVYKEYRRNIRFSLGKQGAVMRLPLHLPSDRQEVEWTRFVEWVKNKVVNPDGHGHAFGRTYANGDTLMVGSRSYQLRIELTENQTHTGKIEAKGMICLRLSKHAGEGEQKKAIQHLLSRLVAQDFKPEITRRVFELNQLFFPGNKVKSVSLKYNRSNWGSCSSRGNINLSTCLLFAPPDVIDYVILHELAHLEEMNHSQKFWSLVEKAMPDYQEKKKWLRENWQICNF